MHLLYNGPFFRHAFHMSSPTCSLSKDAEPNANAPSFGRTPALVDLNSNTSPFSKNTPPSTPIRQNQSPPYALLTNLDDRLPSPPISLLQCLTRTLNFLFLSHQSQDLTTRSLDRQLCRFLRRVCICGARIGSRGRRVRN